MGMSHSGRKLCLGLVILYVTIMVLLHYLSWSKPTCNPEMDIMSITGPATTTHCLLLKVNALNGRR